jgi:hypothetical protein
LSGYLLVWGTAAALGDRAQCVAQCCGLRSATEDLVICVAGGGDAASQDLPSGLGEDKPPLAGVAGVLGAGQ